jgi:hypothetical protein
LSVSLTTLILYTYSILQLSYTLVSHNFGLNILSYGYVNITFLMLYTTSLVLFISIYYIEYGIYNLIYTLNCKYLKHIIYFKNILFIKNLYIYIISLGIIIIYLISFNPILNNILYNYFNLEILNNINNSINLKLMLPLFIYTVFYTNLSLYLIFYLYFIFIHLYNWPLPVIFFRKNTIFTAIHLLLLLILYVSILFNTSTFILWTYLNGKSLDPNLTINYSNYKQLFILDSIYLVYTKPVINYIQSYDFYNLIFWLNSIPNIQSFTINSSDNVLIQSVLCNNYLHNFRISIYDLSINILDFIYQLLNFTLIIYIYFRHKKIIF